MPLWLNRSPHQIALETSLMSEAIYIVSGARTPMGGLMGDLAAVTAPQLGSTAIKAAVERSGLSGDKVDEVFMGCVLPAGLKQCCLLYTSPSPRDS